MAITESTVNDCNQKQIPSLEFERLKFSTFSIKYPEQYDLVFVRPASHDSFIVLARCMVKPLSPNSEICTIRGIDTLDGMDTEIVNPNEVYVLPRPSYLNE